jgi:hypothetical protein
LRICDQKADLFLINARLFLICPMLSDNIVQDFRRIAAAAQPRALHQHPRFYGLCAGVAHITILQMAMLVLF